LHAPGADTDTISACTTLPADPVFAVVSTVVNRTSTTASKWVFIKASVKCQFIPETKTGQ
jgi:hypothetical protein